MKLPCPRCRKPMVEETIERVPVDRCLRCDGVWLDEGELDRIIAAGPAPEPFEGGVEAAPKAEPMDWELLCPKCEMTMHRFRQGEVALDRCAGHGIWFDFEELDRVRRQLKSDRPAAPTVGIWSTLNRRILR